MKGFSTRILLRSKKRSIQLFATSLFSASDVPKYVTDETLDELLNQYSISYFWLVPVGPHKIGTPLEPNLIKRYALSNDIWWFIPNKDGVKTFPCLFLKNASNSKLIDISKSMDIDFLVYVGREQDGKAKAYAIDFMDVCFSLN